MQVDPNFSWIEKLRNLPWEFDVHKIEANHLVFAFFLIIIPFNILLYNLLPWWLGANNNHETPRNDQRPQEASKPQADKPKPACTPPTTITDIRVYPIKSCRGISLKDTRLLKTGIKLDRQWMFVDANSFKFLTIRDISRMTLIRLSFSSDGQQLQISLADKPEMSISLPPYPSKKWLETNTTEEEVEIWGQKTPGRMYPTSYSDFISDFLGKSVRLVYKGPYTAPRILRGNSSPELLGRTEAFGFADLSTLLIANEQSMTWLTQELEKNGIDTTSAASEEDCWTIERFRPNIIVSGNSPWEEDVWKTLRISNPSNEKATPMMLDVVSNCLRCQVPNVNPDTGDKHRNQPWDTLMKTRRIDKGMKFKPAFGMLCVPRDEGRVEIGMKVECLDTEIEHVFKSPNH